MEPEERRFKTPMEKLVDEKEEEHRKKREQHKIVNYLYRKQVGLLSFKEYQRLSTRDKRNYRMRHGAPKCPNEIQSRQKQLNKRKRRRKISKKSRKYNLKRGENG